MAKNININKNDTFDKKQPCSLVYIFWTVFGSS